MHRDIKPSNVLLSPARLPGSRPRAKLADFGIAYLLDASRLTSPGMVVGTVAYLAPEQIRGGEPSPSSDIYSLGLVLLECLTGERAHAHGGGMAAALARLENPPTIPDSLDPRWRALLTRMMDLDPSRRPTAAEVAASAAALFDGTPSGVLAADQTAVTVPFTAPTLIAPAGGLVAASAAPASPSSARVATASTEETEGRRGRRRMLVLIGGALAAVAVALAAIFGFSLLGGPGVTPEPQLTVPAVTDPSEAPPADDDNGDGDDGPGTTDEDRKAAEEARKKAEEERKKLEEEQKKREDEERKSQKGDD